VRSELTVNAPQSRMLQLPHKYCAYVGGFGSGKTYVGALKACLHFLQYPGVNQAYFAPTYSQIRDIYYPTIEEVAERIGLGVTIRVGDREVDISNGRKHLGTVICRSMERPHTIVGFKVGRAMVDELDTMPINKAELAWNKIIARLRVRESGIINGVDVTTTPEGFRFVYRRFVESITDTTAKYYGLVRASTRDNAANLPEDYIESLASTYPAELVSAYIDGEFVNLTGGQVYRAFKREKNLTRETVQPGEPIYVGQDFNVGQMFSVVYIRREAEWHAVTELKKLLDTPDVIRVLAEKYKGHPITIYPDASGAARKSVGATQTDIGLFRQAGFRVKAHESNPLVRDRVLAVNRAFDRGLLKISATGCPSLLSAVEQQAYDVNGEPDKSGGHDHPVDALGYPIAYEMPIIKPTINLRPHLI
jgi:hypothetical protein